MNKFPLPEAFMKEFRSAVDDGIETIIKSLYQRDIVPKGFVFTNNVRIQTRERLLEIMIDTAIGTALASPNIVDALNDMWKRLEDIFHIGQGYLLGYYDFTKGK